MLFNSYVFILLFLPVTWCIYFLLNHFKCYKTAQVALIIGSFIFYGYENWQLCLLLLGTILVNYGFHCLLTRMRPGILRKLVLTAGILSNISLLFYFKYFNFFLGTLNRFITKDFTLRNIALPLGISFFTFQQISMLADSCEPDMERYSFVDYALFVCYFPQLIAGPIVLHQELIPQFKDPEKRRINSANMLSGIEYFIFGFAKKVLVADSFARICDAGYEYIGGLNTYSTILTILAFTLQIYFDFSGYCDMAKGLGRMFNFELPINFDSPYKAVSISDFWKRWHMTLTRFLTTYLYIPLGGNRKGKCRTYINIMIVFTVSGLWHGAAWTYVLWGMLHGFAQVLYRMGRSFFDRLPKWLMWAATFVFVNLAWVFFRAEYFKQAFGLLKGLITGGAGWCRGEVLAAFADNSVWITVLESFLSPQLLEVAGQIGIATWFLLWTLVCVFAPSSHEIVEKRIRSRKYFVILSLIFAWTFVWLPQISKFIYFNF